MKYDLKRLFLFNNLATALLPIVCIGLLSIAVVRHHVIADHDDNSTLLARSVAGQINTYLRAPVGTFNLLANHLQSHAYSSSERSSLLAQMLKSFDYIDSAYLLDERGVVQQTALKKSPPAAASDYLGMDFSGIEICRTAQADRQLHWAPSVAMSSGEPIMSFCSPIKGGTLLAELKLADLGKIINASSSTRSFTAFIVDKSGRIIAHPNEKFVSHKENIANLPLFQEALAGKTVTANFSMHGSDYRGTALRLPELDWVLVVSEDLALALAPVRSLQQILLAGMLVTALLALLLGNIGSRMLRRPFDQLTEIARKVIREDYSSGISVPSSCEEISILSATFSSMVAAISARETALNEQTEELMSTEETLRELNMLLEEKVAERTARLESAGEAMATLNLTLLERSAALEAANKQLEAFAYTVSHDLRAPLRHAGSFAAILLEEHGAALPPDGVAMAQRIVASCRQMEQLIAALLQFSRVAISPVNRSAVQTEKMVHEIMADLEGELAGRQHEVIIRPLPDCQADVILLRQVWANLLGNAVKYTKKTAATRIEVGAISGENEITFYVIDNGAGFDMADKERLFGVFQRLHAAAEFAGTGVGLAIVENIIKRHGGRIWATAAIGVGADFRFTLPLLPPAAAIAGADVISGGAPT